MQKYSNYPQEKEVLLSRGKTYKIKKMTNKGEYLYIVIE
nr:MAG TPA: ADP-ribosyl-(Dinitrogen reductase) hydrolase [Bacteriophage sp.]